MSPEIWFFFTPDGSAEITVMNRESARQVAQLMNSQQRQMWRVRKHRSPDALIVADCDELFADREQIAAAPVPETPAPEARKPEARRATEPLLSADVSLPSPWDAGELSLEESLDAAPDSHGEQDDRVHPGFGGEHARSEDRTEIMQPGARKPAAQAQHQVAAQAQPVVQAQPAHRASVVRGVRQPGAQLQATALHPLAPAAVQPAPVISAAQAQSRTSEADKRKHPRIDARLRVVVISGNRSFRSFTRNISRGGLLLEHIIPHELLERSCRVIIGSADLKENIEFDARLAGDPQNPRAVEFLEGKDLFIRKLDAWMDEMRKTHRAA